LISEFQQPPIHPTRDATIRERGADTNPLSDSKPALKKALLCPLCNSGRDRWELDCKTFGAGPYERDLFAIYRCRCGIGITDPVPPEDQSHLLYEDRGSCDFQGDDTAIAAALKRWVTARDVQAFVGGAQLSRQTAPRMLDYACGNGAFAFSMRRLFPDAKVSAADYHDEAPPMLRGSDVTYSSYKNLPALEPFDFILCRHVLEHTYKPLDFLRTMGALMSPNGVLMIEVPNLRAPLRRVFGKHWDGYYVPYHPIHFSRTALRQAVIDACLVPEKAGVCEMPKIGRSLRNVFHCKYNAALFLGGVLLHPVQFGAQFVSREATCLRMWARKQ
jgi:SAM-dependent methyltransferase